MKRIILDHLKRWGWLWIIIGVANCLITGTISYLDNAHGIINPITFQLILWIGAFELNYDLGRGNGRVLTALPVTARQIGKAWWMFSVALPALFLAVTSGLAIFFQSSESGKVFPMNEFVVTAITNTIFLGSIFYMFIGSLPGRPQNITMWARIIFIIGLVIGMLFVKPSFETPQGIIFFLVATLMTVVGWFRAEQMVLQRAGFRLFAVSSNKKMSPHKIPQGFGGLQYMALRTLIKSTLVGLALISWVTLFTSFFHSGPKSVQTFASQVEGGSTPWIFFIMFSSVIPMVFQLRFLRTLPVSSSALAAMLVTLPVISIAVVGVIITTVASLVLGVDVILPAANSFLMLGVKAAIIVPLTVWRGLDVVTFALIFLLMVSGSLVNLCMTVIYHLTKNPESPWWASLIIFILCVAASFELTRRLLVISSSAFRVRTMPTNAWSMARR